MSKRRIAALSAVVAVSLATFLVVLLTLLSGDDDKSRPISETTATSPRSEPPTDTQSSDAGSKARIDEGLQRRHAVPAPKVTIPVTDDGGARLPSGLDLGDLNGR